MKKLILAAAFAAVCLSLAACSSSAVSAPVSAPSTSDSVQVSLSDTANADETADVPDDSLQQVQKITLSGNPEDVFTAETDCYTEGDKVVLYFGKGVNVRGDMLAMTERVMNELSSITGLDYERNCDYNEYTEFRNLGLENSTFEHINPKSEKINVVLAYNPEKHSIQCAFENGALLDEYDYDMNETGCQILYHELSHVIHLRNSGYVGRTLGEGYAVYLSELAMRQAKMPVWSHIQHYMPVSFDDSIIAKGAEGFSCEADTFEGNYDYGLRMVLFLEETYGKGTFMKVADEAVAHGFDYSYEGEDLQAAKDADTRDLIRIISAATSEDVFDRFAKWYEKSWDDKVRDYTAYMESIGQVIG